MQRMKLASSTRNFINPKILSMIQPLITPTEQADGPNIMRSLWGVVALYRGRVIYSLLFLILAKVATVGVPLMLKRIVDYLSRPESVQTLPILMLSGYALLRFSNTL